ncbi:hypothetical protein TNCT_620301 [Trichonephila clavata]|uniref:C2H2-type domain-containing protein n=1 Tax=Trichonephila clavata TaxID=2740835 RepID=A0A8X6M1H2_TRICU|nr:hypothetical protein TNCT_620301 [Trichonephila clavata]
MSTKYIKGINLDLGNISENSENLQRTNLVKRRAEELIKNLTHTKKKNGYPKVLPCGICTNKRFTSRSSLRSHLRSHAGIKPFKCLLCLKTFTRQQSLNYHTKVHSNENDHTCLRCGRGFRHPNHFKEHLRLHTGETPYSCPECEKRFTTRNTFKRHLRAIHKKVLNRHGIEDLNPDDTSKV